MTDIVADNIRAAQAIHHGAILEQMGIFAVADAIVDHFLTGLLPLSPRATGGRLFEYWKQRPTRLADADRRRLYSRVLGAGPGAATDVTANREFPDLWNRFVRAVAEHARRSDTGTREAAVAAADALGLNLTAHASGGVAITAAALVRHAREALDLLAEPEIDAAYGATTVWQLVDRVSSLYLGGAQNVGRLRMRAEAAQRILTWLADGAGTGTPDVDDSALRDAVEQWLAVSGDDSGDTAPPRETAACVRREMRALLARAPAYAELAPAAQARLARDAIKVATAMVRRRLARARAAGGLIAAVDFPDFVAGLIDGVFHAIVDASLRQMQAYTELLASVSASLDALMRAPRRDDGRDWLTSVAEALLAASTTIVVTDGQARPCVHLRPRRARRR
jgi:hypothetical protein